MRNIAFVSALCLLVLLFGFHLVPLTYNEADLLNQTDLQATRAQRIAKDAQILAYRPVDEHPQAISELQNSLPAWETQQAQLHNAVNPDIQALMTQAQPYFVAMDSASKKLLEHPTGKIDINQVEIIMNNERDYSLAISQVATLLQGRIQTYTLILASIQSVINVLIIICVLAMILLPKKPKPLPVKEDV